MTDTTDVAYVNPTYTTQEMRNIDSFDAAMKLVLEKNGVLHSADELGEGFALLDSKNKEKYCDKAMIFVKWSFNKGDFGDGEFVSANVVTIDGERLIINDGSTGIYQQLRDFTDTHNGAMGGLVSRHGLRKSEYKKMVPDAKDPNTLVETNATTFYIDTTP